MLRAESDPRLLGQGCPTSSGPPSEWLAERRLRNGSAVALSHHRYGPGRSRTRRPGTIWLFAAFRFATGAATAAHALQGHLRDGVLLGRVIRDTTTGPVTVRYHEEGPPIWEKAGLLLFVYRSSNSALEFISQMSALQELNDSRANPIPRYRAHLKSPALFLTTPKYAREKVPTKLVFCCAGAFDH
jgi:hypothetical protein